MSPATQRDLVPVHGGLDEPVDRIVSIVSIIQVCQ